MKRKLVTCLVLLATCAASVPARALPRYAARYHQSCNLCHADPTGGGMRTLYATQFLIPEELAMSHISDEVVEGIHPDITPSITVGADMRTFYVDSDKDAFKLNFFEMQADLYLSIQMSPRLSLYFDRGQSGNYEAFGTAYVLPFSGYVKVGRFTPAYGWKRADHTAFTRSLLGFSPPANTDTGIELSTHPGSSELTVAAVNGSSGATFDRDTDVSFVARAEQRFSISGMHASLGASGRYNPAPTGDERAGGGFGYLAIGRLIWLGEVDWDEFEPPGGDAVTALVHSHEVSFEPIQGLYLLGTYDFYDPDIDRESGYETRYGGGVAALVNQFLDIEVLVRQYDYTAGPDLSGVDHIEALLQFHLLY